MKHDPLAGLLAFVRIAETQSFTAAAAQLGVTPAALSQTITRMEKRLGAQLLHRTTRSVSVTEAGQRYLERCRPALDELSAAAREVVETSDTPSGTLRLSVPRIAWSLYLQPILPAFLAAHPQVTVEISLDDRLVDIVREGFDAGMRLGESIQRDMVGVPLTDAIECMVVASPAYLARHGAPATIDDLARHNCITFRFPTSGRIYKWELERDGRIIEVEVAGNLVVNDGEAMFDAAADGIGLAHVIREAAQPWLERGALVPVLEQYSSRFPGFYLYYPSRKHLPAKMRVFVEFLRERRAEAHSRNAGTRSRRGSAATRVARPA